MKFSLPSRCNYGRSRRAIYRRPEQLFEVAGAGQCRVAAG
jgi:hypothetical protein